MGTEKLWHLLLREIVFAMGAIKFSLTGGVRCGRRDLDYLVALSDFEAQRPSSVSTALLFVAERDCGIDVGRAASWNGARGFHGGE